MSSNLGRHSDVYHDDKNQSRCIYMVLPRNDDRRSMDPYNHHSHHNDRDFLHIGPSDLRQNSNLYHGSDLLYDSIYPQAH